MLSEDKEKKLIEIFIAVDDFCKQLDVWKQSKPEQFPPHQWDKPLLSESELMSLRPGAQVCIFYHYSS